MKKKIILLLLLATSFAFADAQTKILWGYGANFSGYAGSEMGKQSDLKILSHWYNGIIDRSWIFGYTSQTISNWYAQGYGIQLMVWLGPGAHSKSMDYAAGDVITVNGEDYWFQADLERLINVFRGSGPVYGPLYVVLFSELETYGSDVAYKNKLQKSYLDCVQLIHRLCPWAEVGLGFGGYGWSGSQLSTRDLSFWQPSINASDFVCTQSMQDYRNWREQPYQIRSAVKQLGSYGKPVMISHFEIWETPNQMEFAPRQTKPAFINFMNDMYTEESLNNLYDDGLRMWVYTGKSFIRDLSGRNFSDTTFVHNNQSIHYDAITNYQDVAFRQARDFLNAHNETDPVMRLDNTPAPNKATRQLLLNYSFDGDDNIFAPAVNTLSNFTANNLNFPAGNLSFVSYSENTDPHGAGNGKWIHDTGYQGPNVNATSVKEAVDPANASKKNDYISFTVTPKAGQTLDLTWLSFDMQMRTGSNVSNPPALNYCAAVFYQKGNYMFRIGDTFKVAANTSGSTSGWVNCPVDLSKVNFSANEAVEFRIYFWRETENISGLHSRWLEIDNICLYGADEATGIKTISNDDNKYQIYPNPAKNEIFVNGLNQYEIAVYDVSGKIEILQQVDNNSVNISNLSNGIYFARITGNNKTIVCKFIKNNNLNK
ncbi:MAG: T9SS type A sorting domain-containing protein [Dysgonamonadaceae bacterium]|jgi:hypothetical protein|nr:T9SS type A sorting domain-containing protein [Dysgonamonadaceae bacterium]